MFFPVIRGISKISRIMKRISMIVQATTVTGIVWNAWKHSWIVLIISGDVCAECPLGFEHAMTVVAL
jgi:hypothetical protein